MTMRVWLIACGICLLALRVLGITGDDQALWAIACGVLAQACPAQKRRDNV
jgi:hypothetical protein